MKHLGDPMTVMYFGKIMELLAPDDLRGDPQRPDLRVWSVTCPARSHDLPVLVPAWAGHTPCLERPRLGAATRKVSEGLASASAEHVPVVPGGECRIDTLVTGRAIARALATVAD